MAQGSSSHRGSIEPLPSGKHRAVVYAGRDPLTNKRRYLRGQAGTEDQAKLDLTRLQSQVDENRHPKSSITLNQAVALWLDVAKLEDTTRERYEDLIRLYIRPTLGDQLAGKLDAELLETFYARLQRCKELCSGRRAGHTCRPLSGSTVRKIHYIMSGALEQAVRWRHLGVNPAALAIPPVANQTEPDPPSADEAAAVISAAWSDPDWGLLLWVVMITGMRRGEISALRWRHVDLATGTLLVQRANAQTKGGLKEKQTKTRQHRRVAIDADTVALLTEHRERWRQRRELLGAGLSADLYVFSPAPDASTPYGPRSLSHRYHRLAVKLGLRSTRLHSLRHYSATELIAAGVDVRTVAGRLGHGSGGATTLKVYAAFVDEADRRAATTMAGIMPRPVVAPRQPRGPYEVIASELREQIESGQLAAGSQLPTVVDLAATYDVAAGTVNRAVALLRSEGLIDVSRGRRATVSTTPPMQNG